MESIYMIGRMLAVVCVVVIVAYALIVRPKEKDAPKRMSTFQWLMKKRREKKAAEAAAAVEDEPLTMAQKQRQTGEKKVRE